MANKEQKSAVIDQLADRLKRCSIGILSDYRGMNVAEITALRRRLRGSNIEFLVAKNTLTRFAAERVEKGSIGPDLEGPTAIAFGYDDPVEAARVLRDSTRGARTFSVKAAILGNRRLSAEEVQGLSELPSKPVLQARVVGAIQSPMTSLIGVMNGLLSQIAYVVDQRAQQLEGQSA